MRASSVNSLQEPGACPDCGMPPDVPGYLRADVLPSHEDFGRLIPCPTCHARKTASRLVESSQLGGWLARASFGNYEVGEGNTDGYNAAWRFANKPVGWLTLWGSYGVGKTHLLASVANYLIERQIAVLYFTLPDLMDVLRRAIGDGDFDGTFYRAVNVPVLLVDEVDKINKTDWTVEKVYELVDARYRALDSKGTAFAMNVEPKVTGDAWDYLYSRMRDRRNEVVKVGGGDMRGVT
jgi:DNA replication protein DnaC